VLSCSQVRRVLLSQDIRTSALRLSVDLISESRTDSQICIQAQRTFRLLGYLAVWRQYVYRLAIGLLTRAFLREG
jgi:hypothetical protein